MEGEGRAEAGRGGELGRERMGRGRPEEEGKERKQAEGEISPRGREVKQTF